jgi:hypothetical protein
MSNALRLARGAALLMAALAVPAHALPAAEPPVRVLLWFDTEDYLLPASDDAAKRLAELLTRREIHATFKVVGEKARVLEKRGRADVIGALRRHDIGYHTDFHAVHPTVAEYLATCGWADGLEEFLRRESAGAEDVKRIFDVETLACYGQPGSSFAPQVFAALPDLGVIPDDIPVYIDEGDHVGLGGKPFWFAGALTVYRMSPNWTRMELHKDEDVEKGCAKFKEIYDRLRGEGGGLISIFYHPCEWVHQQFWDGVNFSRGANPPRERWKAPPQRPAEETEAAFKRFEKYIDFQKSLPGVTFVTASELPVLYPDAVRERGVDLATVLRLASDLKGAASVGVVRLDAGRVLSPADQFVALVTALAARIRKEEAANVEVRAVYGPAEPPPATEVESLDGLAFRDALLDVDDALTKRDQVPSCVFAGSKKIAPADFLVACARVADAFLRGPEGAALPEQVAVPKGTTLETEKHVAPDTPGLYGGWVIHPEGFRAPRLVEQTRLQAWTLKPATLKAE